MNQIMRAGIAFGGKMEKIIKSVLLGILQGLTEFLPVSSSGHLAVFKNIFGMEEVGLAFDILLHVGTLIAVFVVFYKDILQLIVNGFAIVGLAFYNAFLFVRNLFSKEKKEYKKILDTPYRRFVMLVIVATLPTAVMGLLLNDTVEALGKTLIFPGIFLICTGIILLLGEKVSEGDLNEENLPYHKALIVGICQGIAVFPGISRSGSTITAARVCKADKEFAVKFSFILSIPVILGSAVLDLPDFFKESAGTSDFAAYIAGMIAAALVGYFCIKFMLKLIKNKGFKVFAYYCFLMGAFSIIMFLAGF